MFSLVGSTLKYLAIMTGTLVLSQLVRYNGVTISDHVRNFIGNTKGFEVAHISPVREWDNITMKSSSEDADQVPQQDQAALKKLLKKTNH